MNRLDIVGVVVSPRSSHPFGLDVVGHDVATIRELPMADCTFPVLLYDFSVQQLPHLGWRSEFAVSPGVVRIVDALNTKLKSAFFARLLATAAE